jgi:hypothetical protein
MLAPYTYTSAGQSRSLYPLPSTMRGSPQRSPISRALGSTLASFVRFHHVR